MHVKLPWILLLATAWSSSSMAEVASIDRAPFAFSVAFNGRLAGVDTTAIGDSLRLDVQIGAVVEGTLMSMRVSVPPAVGLVQGDTARTVTLRPGLNDESRWLRIICRPRSEGAFVCRGYATFLQTTGGSSVRDDAEWELPIIVHAGTVCAGPTKYFRPMRYADGKSFTYIRGWLVPAEADEHVPVSRSVTLANRVTIVESTIGQCPECAQSDTTLRAMIVVSGSGRLLDIGPIANASGAEPGAAAVEATRTALAKWHFSPAQLGGRGVTEWRWVDVTLRRSP